MLKSPRRALTAIAILTAIGCGGDDGSGPTGSISLTASPSALTLQQGASGTVTVTLVRGGGFANPVNVAVTGLPAGVTLSVTPTQLTGATTQATVTVNVANTVPAGTYTATVTATATGIGSATATYTLTVTALPTFSLTATPAAVSIGQGASGTTTIGVVRTNFTGPVALTLVSPPTGITGSFNPTPATADQSVLTINVAGTVAPGNFTLTVNGSSAGQTDKTTTVTLTVLPPPNYQLSTTPNSVSIPAGATGTTTVNIDRTNFTGAVTLALDAPPQGITATFNPAAPTGNTSTATISVPAIAVLGTYNVTIKGTASGVSGGDRTTTVAVTVTAAANFTISATPATLSIAAGANSNTSVAIVRTNFTTDVALSLVSPPTGITGVFTPATLTGATLTSNLVISVAASVAPGNQTITVQGVGGSLTKTATVTVTVTPAAADFTMSATPATLSIAAGANGNSSVAIVRTNFTTDVALTLVSPPTGITGVFTPATLTGATLTSNLVISVAASVAPGNHTLTVQGAGGSLTKTTTVALTVTAASDFTISATPATLSIAAGGNSNTSVAIVRTNFTTDVALSLVSPPTGITGVFTPATLTGATLTSNLVVSVAASVAPGSHTLTVQGAGGVLTKTTTVALTVTAAANVTLSMSPTTLSIQQGGSGQATLNAVRTNYTGNITPSYTGAPAGMTVTFNPNPITSGNSATVNVSVGGSVATGLHTLTITGATGGAAGTATTTLAVTVTAPTGGSNVVWEFCNGANNVPTKFWSLSGGTWTEVSPTVLATVTRFSFTVASGSTGIAYNVSASGFSNTIVFFTQSTELGGLAAVCATPTTVAKTFNLSGQVGGEVGQLGYGGAAAQTGAAASYILNVAPGTYDWLWAFGSQSGFPPTTNWTNYRIGRGEAAPGAGAVAVNRTGAAAFVTAPFSFTGGGAGFWQTIQSLGGANGFVTSLSIGSILTGTGSGDMLFPQPGDRLSTDMWLLSATNLEVDQNGKGDTRTSSRYVGSAPPGSLTFAMPGKVPAFTVSAAAGASIPFMAAGSTPAEYQNAASTVSATFTGAGSSASASLIATRSWLVANGMSTSYTLTGPTLPGFLAQWAPGSPLAASTVSMSGTNLTGPPSAGGFINSAVRIQ